MSHSRLQEPFMREVAATFIGIKNQIIRRLADAPTTAAADIVEDELQSLYHGLFVIFDGGTPLADEGLVRVMDEDGEKFDRFLHEICFEFWPMRAKHTKPEDGP